MFGSWQDIHNNYVSSIQSHLYLFQGSINHRNPETAIPREQPCPTNCHTPMNRKKKTLKNVGLIPIFACIFVCVYVCLTRPGQTVTPILMKIGTHTHLKARKKRLPQIFDKIFSGLPDPFFSKKGPFWLFFNISLDIIELES